MNTKIPHALKAPVIKRKDYLHGTIEYKELNLTGDWSVWLPTRERQRFAFDTNECSTISALKCIEIQFNFLRNDMSIAALQWFTDNGYIDENGNFNFSERFSGIMAGTSIDGNSQNDVWESIRNVGLLPQKDLNYTMEQSQQFLTQRDMCEDYYNPRAVTKEMKDKAERALRWVEIEYEWTASGAPNAAGIITALKQAPVQIGTPVCPDWNTGNVHLCSDLSVAHATTIYKANRDGSWGDFDHYNPFTKTLSKDYYIPYAVKGVVTIRPLLGDRTVSFSVIQQFIKLLKDIGAFITNK